MTCMSPRSESGEKDGRFVHMYICREEEGGGGLAFIDDNAKRDKTAAF